MIQLNVNGAEQSFNDEPEMPLLWCLRDGANRIEIWLRSRTLRRVYRPRQPASDAVLRHACARHVWNALVTYVPSLHQKK